MKSSQLLNEHFLLKQLMNLILKQHCVKRMIEV